MSNNNYIPPEERAKVMAYTMDLVRNLQNQDQGDPERTYYQQMQADRNNGAQLAAQEKQDSANMLVSVSGNLKEDRSSESTKDKPGSAKTEDGKSEDDSTKWTSDWPLRDVKEPHKNDVLYGRGGKSNHHPGNKRFRQAVKEREFDYLRRKNKDKQLVAMEVVRNWRNQDPPGRFLKKDDKTGLWQDVGDQKAREKTSQAFRENSPHHQPPMFHHPPRMAMPSPEQVLMWPHVGSRFASENERVQTRNDQPPRAVTKKNQAEV